MHTEDDKKKKVNKNKKNEAKQLDNFYENQDSNELDGDFSNFYNVNETYEETENTEPENNEKSNNSIKKIIFIIILLLLLGILVFILLKISNKKDVIPPSINLTSSGIDTWSNNDVTINIDNPSNATIKYTINCDNECDYAKVVDNKIVITNSGTNKVSVIAEGKDGGETKKDVIIKIDKNAPSISLSPNNTKFVSDSDITVCAVCSDKESGCKEEKNCKTYTKSASNQKLVVYDNAGNASYTSAFSVTINKETTNEVVPTCSLSVTSDGVVKANVKNATYYGFSSSYSGTNATSKTLSKATPGEEKITYYVKNSSSGKTNTCSITVKYSDCRCNYRGDNGKCYRTLVKIINDPNSKECANATKKDKNSCAFFKDEGLSCKYEKK